MTVVGVRAAHFIRIGCPRCCGLFYALIADIETRPCNEFLDLVLTSVAERTEQHLYILTLTEADDQGMSQRLAVGADASQVLHTVGPSAASQERSEQVFTANFVRCQCWCLLYQQVAHGVTEIDELWIWRI